MITHNNYTLTACAVLLATLAVQADASDNSFLAAQTSGEIYLVDSDTYSSRIISQVDETFAFNEMEYIGNNTIIYNSGANIIRRNLMTEQETSLYATRTGFETGFFRSGGLTIDTNGDYLYNVTRIANGGSIESHLVRLDSQTFEATSIQLEPWVDLFDLHVVDNNLLLGALYGSSELILIDSNTGEYLDRFGTSEGISSVFQQSDGLYGIGIGGNIYSIDLDTQSLTLSGSVGGSSFIAASGVPFGQIVIPAPSSVACIGFASIFAFRRRR